MGSNDSRIVSMDQFRGYTVVGMILVNYIGEFARSILSSSTTTRISAMPTASCRRFTSRSASLFG